MARWGASTMTECGSDGGFIYTLQQRAPREETSHTRIRPHIWWSGLTSLQAGSGSGSRGFLGTVIVVSGFLRRKPGVWLYTPFVGAA